MNRDDIRPGRIYHVGADCGVPHGFRPIHFRVIAVGQESTWAGMAFLEGYELDRHGQGVARRRIYVIVAGLVDVTGTYPRVARRPRNTPPAATRLSPDLIRSTR